MTITLLIRNIELLQPGFEIFQFFTCRKDKYNKTSHLSV